MYLQPPFFFFSSRRRHTRWLSDWSSDVCSFRSADRSLQVCAVEAASSALLLSEHTNSANLSPIMKRKIGVGLIVAAYTLFLYIALSALAYARAHQHHGAQMLAEYAAPWPVALAGSLGLAGIVLALIPI